MSAQSLGDWYSCMPSIANIGFLFVFVTIPIRRSLILIILLVIYLHMKHFCKL